MDGKKRLAAIVLGALLFGVIAGGTFAGINVAANRLLPAAPQQEVQADAGTSQARIKVQEAQLIQPAETVASIGETEKKAYSTVLDVSDLVEEAMPQVVSITNTMLIKQRGYGSLFDYFYGGSGYLQEYEVPASGSGIIVGQDDDELLLVTNNHVIEDSKELSVTFVNGTTLNAHIKGKDSQLDVAVIAVNLSDIDDETLKAIKIARLHGEEDLRVGQGVVAIGNALGYGQAVTVGVISALDRNIQASASDIRSGLIQVDAAINPGNSGGALLNMYGEVIGINVAKMADTEVEGMGYAIPIYKALDVINTLSEKEEVVDIADERQGRLGIYIDTVSAQSNMPGGVLISGFSDEEVQGGSTELKESPAKKAGLMKYDIITKFDGKEVKTAEELQGYCKASEAGSTVKLTYMRLENGEYKEYTADVVLGKKNDPVIRSTKKPEAEETKPEETEPKESAVSDEGSGDGNEKKSYDQEIYDLFREFMEKYR